jgi:hypothetical protein
MTDITRILGIAGKTQWDSFKYLGVPIFKATAKSSCWAPLVDKIKARISAWGSSWLNPAGKIVLIKSVLSSIPIYQSSILLAPKGIISKVDALLRRFLWKGGRNNDNKLPLVSWRKISRPLSEGGLQLRDLHSQNLALGAKLLWNVISGRSSWCKKAIWKKYFSGSRLRCLDSPPKTSHGSPIYSICSKAHTFFAPALTWIPGNGKQIRIWEDSIMGDPPLDNAPGLEHLKAS